MCLNQQQKYSALETIEFNKTECGVDFLINVLHCSEVEEEFLPPSVHNTDCFEVLVFKKGNGTLLLDSRVFDIQDNTIVLSWISNTLLSNKSVQGISKTIRLYLFLPSKGKNGLSMRLHWIIPC